MSCEICQKEARRQKSAPAAQSLLSRGPAAPRFLAVLAGVALLIPALAPAASAGGSETPATDAVKLEVELNKLEAKENACRAFFVVNNQTKTEYETLKLDLVLFQPDGVIGRRLLVNLAPLKGEKRVIKQFDLEGTACDAIGSLLINDVSECKSLSGSITNCMSGMSLKSLTKVPLTK